MTEDSCPLNAQGKLFGDALFQTPRASPKTEGLSCGLAGKSGYLESLFHGRQFEQQSYRGLWVEEDGFVLSSPKEDQETASLSPKIRSIVKQKHLPCLVP